MTKTASEIILNCFQIENTVREIILMKGILDNKTMVEIVDEVYHPEDLKEMEMYSEAILLSKMAVLN